MLLNVSLQTQILQMFSTTLIPISMINNYCNNEKEEKNETLLNLNLTNKVFYL